MKIPGAIGDWGNGYGEKLTLGMSGEGRDLTSPGIKNKNAKYLYIDEEFFIL